MPFSYLGIFKGDNPLKNDLYQVLSALFIRQNNIEIINNKNISYVLGVLLINMDKYQAYQCLVNIINNRNRFIFYEKPLNINYSIYNEEVKMDTPTGDESSTSVSQINLRRMIFKQLIFVNLPELCTHLELLNVLPEDYFDEWSATMFSKNFNIDRNYDYIFLSNIKDWVCVDSTYRNNIDKLLRPGGYVICSTLGSYGASSDEIMLLDMGYDY